MGDDLIEFPGLDEIVSTGKSDPIDQLHYHYQDTIDMGHCLLTAVGKMQYRAHNAGMMHLSFELYAEPPTLYDLTHEIVNTFPGDDTWRKMRYTEVMAERKLYIYGNFLTLKEHLHPYIFLVVTHFDAQAINWQNEHGRWILRAPWLTAKLELK